MAMGIDRAVMKAAICRRYGPPDVVTIGDLPVPRPGARQVLVRVRATTVSAGDVRLRSARVPRGFGLLLRLGFGISGPRHPVLGAELAGEVVDVGRSVTRFSRGNRVFASLIGCHAEYVAVPEDAAALMPSGLSFATAAALTFGGLTALLFLRDKARVQPGARVLVNGASGTVGSAAVQLARHFGAIVTGVCSAGNAALVRSLGADEVIDHAAEDFTAGRERYDVILDAVGNCSFARCRRVLAPGGRLLLVVGDLPQMLGALLRPSRGDLKVLGGIASVRREDLLLLAELAERGAFKPVIDRSYPFARIADAHAHVDTGRKKGSVVIELG
ncbi:NAD(P)-dependent alcohol dehydrogenase [Piscinibacter sakaiensis]|uniref:NAD(P)-dependent alcohol dehydrogenase n=1 Tax=Piscinibacter sakaiensis TaxID=1547922 RepID=UPI003AAF4520